MLEKVLVANRGEIACRIMRAARRLGIATVAVYSEADRRTRHVADADEAILIGPPPAADSYLRIDRIMEAARLSRADCIHPGFGFLSENAAFAEACRAAGIAFIGPSPEAMRVLGDKAAARALAEREGLPVVSGYNGASQDPRLLAREAGRIGYPVMIKAAAGGGGRGMRVVERPSDFAPALESAVREAEAAFGDGRVLLEKLVTAPRHVEVQIFGDCHGNVVHVYERDCSLQRRHQKVIEEAPAPGIASELRSALTDAAVRLGQAARYEGAGTVEFLVGEGRLSADAPWYFIEANTRLQVEHPVSEEVTGLDLVEWQFRVAAGEELPKRQREISLCGHSVEARLYAEDPAAGFRPSTGLLIECAFAEGAGVRVESGVRAGDEITSYYDPMIAKIIATGQDRGEALDRLCAALAASRVLGPVTNASFLKALVDNAEVRGARIDTGLIGREIAALTRTPIYPDAIRQGVRRLLEIGTSSSPEPDTLASPWQAGDAFSLGPPRRMTREIVANGDVLRVEIAWGSDGPEVSLPDAGAVEKVSGATHIAAVEDRVYVLCDLVQTVLSWPEHDGTAAAAHGDGIIRAPINGRVAKVFACEGDTVARGDRIAVLEAMKMEHVLHADRSGRLVRLPAREGQQLSEGALVAEIVGETP